MTDLAGRLELVVGREATAEAAGARCQACGGEGVSAFYQTGAVPTQSCVLLDTAEEARTYPTGEVLLGFCPTCGFIQNTRFDPGLVDYSMPTEESQAYSPKFQRFSEELVADLSARHHLERRAVLEIGCGKGDFLASLAERGVSRATGIDPGFLPDRSPDQANRLTFIRDWFDHRHTDQTADLVIARHLLEHVPDVLDFAGLMVESLRHTTGAAMFVELPDVRRVLVEGAFWDIYYEHCSYFSPGSLGRLLRRLGLDVDALGQGFGDQYILAEAVDGSGDTPHPAEEAVEELAKEVESFAAAAAAAAERWRRRLDSALSQGRRVTVWGGGSKAVAFLTTLGTEEGTVQVVDINPHKQGKFLPGCGIEVEAPRSVVERPPDLVVVMNPLYRAEIQRMLGELGVSTEVATVT